MGSEKSYRINGFEQIKSFYSWVFANTDKSIGTTHISLYLFLINQANRNNWVEWFKCPYDLGMAGSRIGSRNTYYKCLSELKDWGLLDYQKGINYFKAPIIKLYRLKNEHVSVPNSEQVSEPLSEPVSGPLPEHIYKLITSNLKPITDNFTEFEKFVKRLSKVPAPNKYEFIDSIIDQFVQSHGSYEIVSIGKERAAAGKLLNIYKKKFPDVTSDETLQSLRAYFNACVNISDPWLHDNMSLSIIISKFNEINNYLKNGKHQKNTGATPAEIAGAVGKHFATDRER